MCSAHSVYMPLPLPPAPSSPSQYHLSYLRLEIKLTPLVLNFFFIFSISVVFCCAAQLSFAPYLHFITSPFAHSKCEIYTNAECNDNVETSDKEFETNRKHHKCRNTESQMHLQRAAISSSQPASRASSAELAVRKQR